MKSKTKIQTVFILIITVGLLGLVAYFSYILSKRGETSVTQVKKTKASAQTYHKLLALNVTPVQKNNASVDTSQTQEAEETLVPTDSVPTNPVSSPQPTLIAVGVSSTPIPTATKVPTPTIMKPTQEPTIEVKPENVTEPDMLIPTTPPTPTSPLLAYRTISPTLIPVRDTGTEITNKPTPIPSKKVFSKDTLPESGWGIQQSMILFIVAATTIFLSFLF